LAKLSGYHILQLRDSRLDHRLGAAAEEIVEAHQKFVEQIAELAQSMNGKEMKFDIEITGDTNIVRDLNLDSLAAMDFIMALETKFDTLIPVDSMADIQTVGDLARLLQSQVGKAAVV
jgi:acyl carrier protein